MTCVLVWSGLKNCKPVGAKKNGDFTFTTEYFAVNCMYYNCNSIAIYSKWDAA